MEEWTWKESSGNIFGDSSDMVFSAELYTDGRKWIWDLYQNVDGYMMFKQSGNEPGLDGAKAAAIDEAFRRRKAK